MKEVDAHVLQKLGHFFEMDLLLVDVVLGRVVLESRPADPEPGVFNFLVTAVRFVHHLLRRLSYKLLTDQYFTDVYAN